MNALFYGLEPRWFSNNRAYKIYERSGRLVGIRVGGQFYNKTSVRTQLAPLYLTVIGIPVVELLAAWADRRRRVAEERLDRDFNLAESLKDSSVLALSNVESVKLLARRSWWTIARNSGSIIIRRSNGSVWKLIAYGRQNLDKIGVELQKLGVAVDRPT